MIEVQELTRRYGSTLAVDSVSFRVEKGDVVGFLGPNGAGKSTTMRILSGSLGATEGRALVDGRDVFQEPLAVKGKIGYLPELPPLYGHMPVRDYVAFAASIKGVADPAAATKAVLGKVGLESVAERVIDHLSKGYRQRVGLAQALVHDPEVLILDEPTSGLDPAQRVEIRELLRELASEERTVILSTHVLAEVEAVCERVIIISEGKLRAQGSIRDLTADQEVVQLQVARPGEALVSALQALPSVRGLEELGEGRFAVKTTGDGREAVASAAIDFGLLELTSRQRLEDLYLRVTAGGDP